MNKTSRRISVNAAYERLGRFVVRFRWGVVAFWSLAAIVSIQVFPSLSSEANDNNSAFLSPTPEPVA